MNTISVRLEEERKEEQRRKIISVLVTFLVTGGLLGLLTIFGLTYFDPPPPEQGVVVAIEAIEDGNAGGGSGSPSEASSSPESSSEESFETQETESPEEAPSSSQTPSVNPLYQFNPSNNNNNNNNTNDNNSNNPTSGDGDLLANGIGNGVTAYIGNGRGVTNTIKPTCDFEESGTVVVKIKVNRDGRVTNAEPVYKYKRKNVDLVSTATHQTNFECARRNALKITFKPNDNAPEVQEGAVTFEFKLK